VSIGNKYTEQLWSPALRRARQDWKNERDIIELFAEVVWNHPELYPQENPGVASFIELVKEMRSVGYEKSEDTAPMAEWIRQSLGETIQKSSQEWTKKTIKIPKNLQKSLDSIRKSIRKKESELHPFKASFRKIETLEFARKRAQLLYGSEDLSIYLEDLVLKEQSGLRAPSGTLFDLLEICEFIVRRKGLHLSKSFEVCVCDLWAPEISLGIEVRDEFDPGEEGELFRLLTLSRHHYETDHLAVVFPSNIDEKSFQSCRTLQHIIANLKVLRINEFESFIAEISLAAKDAKKDMPN